MGARGNRSADGAAPGLRRMGAAREGEAATPTPRRSPAAAAALGAAALALGGALTWAVAVRAPAEGPKQPAQSAPAVAPADGTASQTAQTERPSFDENRAWKDLEKQVAFGPRVPATAGHRACRDYLVESLKPLADSVERQDFIETLGGKRLPMTNVIARWKGKGAGEGVLLCAHWDTRPTADQEFSPADRRKPILGANDGASGVAVLLEAARLFKQQPPPVPVTLVLFDGEDYGPDIDRMFLGSRYFAAHLPTDAPKRGILLDMVGDKDLRIPKEGYSVQEAPQVVDEVYGIARRLGLERHFPNEIGAPIMDDHLPLHQKGLKVIDLIDFDYGPNHAWWHTKEDTPDKCSPASLKAVGAVVTEWVYSR